MKFTERFNGIPALKARLKEVEKAKTQIGWWSEQKHGEITSPDLAKILHNGADLKGGQPYAIINDDIVFLRKDSALGQKALKAGNGGSINPKTAQSAKSGKIKGLGVTKPSHIPARPFFTITAEQKKDKWVYEDALGIANGVILGKISLKYGLKALGEAVKADVQEVMGKASNFTPNAPSVIKRKGKNTPLIDTNQLRETLTVKVAK